MKIQDCKKLNIPDKPGVYFFKSGKDTLYIGKATSLRSRTRSYFAKDLIATRGPNIVDMVFRSTTVDWQVTESVLEALLLEAELIKKYQPHYNIQIKDDKSFNMVVITREDFPKVMVVRKRELIYDDIVAQGKALSKKYQAIYGPFTNGMQLREALKIIRRIFPFLDAQSAKRDNYEFYKQLGLNPDVQIKEQEKLRNLIRVGAPGERVKRADFTSSPALSEASAKYKETIKNLKLFFCGRKKDVIRNMKKEMNDAAKEFNFEYAAQIRNRIFALEHINDVSLMKEDPIASLEKKYFGNTLTYRIEAYDIAHMSGKNMVGVMTVIEDDKAAKQEYRKFIIRTQKGSNDTGALEEVLSRRFRHTEWGLPSLIVVDGSTAQLNVAKQVLNRYQFDIPVISVIKDNTHKARAIMGDEILIQKHKKSILLANSEAHRFAITFHKLKRGKNFLPK